MTNIVVHTDVTGEKLSLQNFDKLHRKSSFGKNGASTPKTDIQAGSCRIEKVIVVVFISPNHHLMEVAFK